MSSRGIQGEHSWENSVCFLISHSNTIHITNSLAEVSTEYSRAIDKPLRLTVSDIYKGGAQNQITVSGRIESGYIQEGDTLLTIPNKEKVSARTILVNDEPRQWAVAGHNVSVQLTGFDQLHLRYVSLIQDEAPS